MKLSDSKKRAIFKDLATKSQYRTGLENGLDKVVGENNIKVINAVRKIYTEVKEEPEKFGIDNGVVEMVEKGMDDRKKEKGQIIPQEQNFGDLEEKDFKGLVSVVRNKSWELVDKKLDYLSKNNKKFKETSIMTLMKVAGISFDKGQIAKGEATEHIAMKAQVDENMSSKEIKEQLLKIRETNVSSKEE